MSGKYKTVTDRLIEIFTTYRTGALSTDLSEAVTAVKKGQYMPTGADSKPILFVRFEQPGLISEIAGNQRRRERLLFRISGGCVGDSQSAAIDDATNLMNNVENILMNHAAGEDWGTNGFGYSHMADDENPEVFGKVIVDPGTDRTIAYFNLLWSGDVLINTEPLS